GEAAAPRPLRRQLEPGQPGRGLVAVRRHGTRAAHGGRRGRPAVSVGAGGDARRLAGHPVPGAAPGASRRRARQRGSPLRVRAREAGGGLTMTPGGRLTSVEVASFVADGAARFDAVVPRALAEAALAELADGGPPSPFGAPAGSPAAGWPGRPLAGLFQARP